MPHVMKYCGPYTKDEIYCVDSIIYLKLVRFDEQLHETMNMRNQIITEIGEKKFQELSPLYDSIIKEMEDRIEFFEDERPNIIVRLVFFSVDLSWLGYEVPEDEYKETRIQL